MQDYVEERDGAYYIAGTRISLDSIVFAFRDGESPESILESFPMAGPLVRIYGAITFYLENTEKVEAYLFGQERRWEELRQTLPPLPEAMARRLREAKERATAKPV